MYRRLEVTYEAGVGNGKRVCLLYPGAPPQPDAFCGLNSGDASHGSTSWPLVSTGQLGEANLVAALVHRSVSKPLFYPCISCSWELSAYLGRYRVGALLGGIYGLGFLCYL